MIELLKTLIIHSMVLSKRAVAATMIPENLAEAAKSSKRGLGRLLWSISVDGKDFVGVTLEDSCWRQGLRQ